MSISKSFALILSGALVLTNFHAPIARAQTTSSSNSSNAAQSSPQQLAARTALSQGRALLNRGSAEKALVLLEQAVKLFTQASDAKGAAAAHDALGDLYSRQGQYTVALNHYKEAHSAYSAGSDSYNANLMLAKIGDMNYRRGNIQEASNAYNQMDVKQPVASNALDTARGAQSKVNKARSIFGRARDIATTTPSASTTSSVASVGTDALSQVRAARDTYRQFIIYSIYELGMGRLDYFNNRLDSAKKHFENALASAGGNLPLIGQLGQMRRFRVAARTGLGDIALRQGLFNEAVKFYAAAADGARKDKRPDLVWPALRGTGRSLLAQAAREKDQKKSAKLREAGINSYREALKVIETLRAGSLGADEARSTFLATTKDVFDEASSALAERALMSQASTSATLQGDALVDAAEAFRIVEQGRARSLLDMLGEAGANITEGVPADLLKRKQENLDRQQEIAQTLTGVGSASASDNTEAKSNEDLEAELERLQTEYDSIENQIRTSSPRYAALTLPQPLTLAEVQQQVLDDKTALLEYSLGDEQSYLWAATQSGLALYKLPARKEVEQQALDLRAQLVPARLRAPIAGINVAASNSDQTQRGLGLSNASSAASSSSVAAFAAASSALYKTVFEPAAAMVGDKRVVVVADGALNYVPFETLVSATTGADYAALPYLIKTNEIAYAPSASVIAVVRRQTNKTSARDVLLVADPVFNANDQRARGASAGAQDASAGVRGLGLASALTDVAGTPDTSATATTNANGLQLARLSGTRTEAEQIAKLAQASGARADVWLDLNASEANIETRDIKKYRVVHIATHGLLNAERPQFTGLVLSLVGNKSGDGFLRTDEVFNLDLGAPLVMLSACETGLGKEKSGEGVIGLTRAFMYAGAPTVGVSLWSVSDRSTAELMTDFYRRLLTGPGTSPAAAMRAAQTSMIAGKRYSAPFYWAPFVLVGEWR